MSIIFKEYNCIGILGGTFNPVHNGHIMLAKEVIKQFPDIEKLLLMPNNLPAYKETDDIVSSEHRLNMLKLICDKLDKTLVSDLEILRGGTTYTIDTLNDILNYNPNIRIYFIIGADSLYQIEKWKEYKDILKKCSLIVAKRDCDLDDIKSFSSKLEKKYPYCNIYFLDTKSINISSSQLRKQAKSKELDRTYLHDDIINYIINNNLYGWN